jgi:hypothetical protein
MPVIGYSRIDDNDFEKLIPLAQTAASISPIKLKVDDGDVAALIMALEVAAGLPAAPRHQKIDRQDWEDAMIGLQGKLNMRTVTITIATPAVVTLAAHGWVAGQAIQFFTTGALPTGITAGIPYYVSATGLAAGAFQFSATKGGASVNTSGTQSGVQSVYAV